MKFYFSGDALYKRDTGVGLLRCLDKEQTQWLINVIHVGVCGPLLAKKILRMSHYLISLKDDCDNHVRRAISAKFILTSFILLQMNFII